MVQPPPKNAQLSVSRSDAVTFQRGAGKRGPTGMTGVGAGQMIRTPSPPFPPPFYIRSPNIYGLSLVCKPHNFPQPKYISHAPAFRGHKPHGPFLRGGKGGVGRLGEGRKMGLYLNLTSSPPLPPPSPSRLPSPLPPGFPPASSHGFTKITSVQYHPRIPPPLFFFSFSFFPAFA